MTKIAKSILVIIVVSIIAIGATTAAWSDTEVVDDNAFSTGTLDLTTSPTTALFNVTGMYPGYSEERPIVVTNNGSVPFDYDIVASMVSDSTPSLYNSAFLELKIGTESGLSDIYDGTVSGLSGGLGLNLSVGANETLFFTVGLNSGADDMLQGLSTVVDFTFSATQ